MEFVCNLRIFFTLHKFYFLCCCRTTANDMKQIIYLHFV